MTLVLQTLRGDQTLNLRSLGVRFLAFTLRLNLTTNDELANLCMKTRISLAEAHTLPRCESSRIGDEDMYTHIIILGEVEELPNLRSTLGTQTLRMNHIGDTGDVVFTLLDNRKSQDRQIHCDDAATDRLALAFTSATGSIAGMTFGEEKSDASGMHDALLHGKTLLVVATGDLENVALELVTD